jgi:hypothetical protein
MARKLSPKQLAARLRACLEEYEHIKGQIRDVGFICEGSLLERWMTCRKPNCRCAAVPPQLHGPYYQLTRKEQGRSVCRNLSPEHARLYRLWVANRRELDELLKRMRKVSEKAGRYLLEAAAAEPETAPNQPQPARSRPSHRT